MGSYFLLPLAERDLEDIHRHTVSEWNRKQARKYLAELRGAFEHLAAFPRSGPAWRPGAAVRTFVKGRHRILYRETPKGIEIGRVLHQAQQFSRDLERYESFLRRAPKE